MPFVLSRDDIEGSLKSKMEALKARLLGLEQDIKAKGRTAGYGWVELNGSMLC